MSTTYKSVRSSVVRNFPLSLDADGNIITFSVLGQRLSSLLEPSGDRPLVVADLAGKVRRGVSPDRSGQRRSLDDGLKRGKREEEDGEGSELGGEHLVAWVGLCVMYR